METDLIGGAAVGALDAEIVATASKAAGEPGWDAGMNAYRIGVRNEAGAVYRWIGCDDLGEYMRVIQTLLGLPVVDELRGVPAGRDGFDSILRPK